MGHLIGIMFIVWIVAGLLEDAKAATTHHCPSAPEPDAPLEWFE